MPDLRFEWDKAEAKSNLRKQGVSFQEARAVFFDEAAQVFADPDHSEDEDRFLILGISSKLRVLVVSHCLRESDSVIRIISTRNANSRESEYYWSNRT